MTTTAPLIEAQALARALGQTGTVVVDCRFDLKDPAAGRAAYGRAHIPGARYADLDRDLSRPPRPEEGRHPLPAPADFAATLGGWGITSATTVVAYDEGSGAIAARLWWLLRWLGHGQSLVLDGGLAAWEEAGLPLEAAPPQSQPAEYRSAPVASAAVVACADIVAQQRRGDLVVDARGAPRYRGEQEPIDPVAGHVPGARNWPFAKALTAEGRFRPADELRADLLGLLDGRSPSQLIAMCGSGVTACHLLLAMAAAGLPDGKLFAGSWSEWIRDRARPVAVGAEP
jgi:thiosulfate/3-mercaptopyruvate sulfurtransferase